jgi:outer membrane receptor protein involved in Fe transport
LFAQGLEEIVVTAQRREQSLQEVPISIEVISGAQLRQQGFRVMDDLANFSPSVEIDMRVQDQDISIRGMGTTGNNLSLEQSAPTFVDNIHFGRTSMIKGAFFDLERIEVLRGPQPVTFGQNAVAGAFNLTTRKPTAEWEGDVSLEVGNFDRKTIEGGIGGPITDTIGIRVAGKWDTLEGYMEDIFTGYRYPMRKDLSMRGIVQWTPNENFSAIAKAEYTDAKTAGDGVGICRTPGDFPDLRARLVLFPGEVAAWDAQFNTRPMSEKCWTQLGVHDNGPFPPKPVFGIIQEEIDGVVNMNQRVLDRLTEIGVDLNNGLESFDQWDNFNTMLGLNYETANGIGIQANTGFISFGRSILEDNDYSPIMTNAAVKGEAFEMWSQELRVSSPRGGTFEWEFGGHYQEEKFRENPFTTIEAGIRQSQRLNVIRSDTNWKSVFGAVTFNFLDNKASIDVGARYSEVEKEGFAHGFGATYIFNVNPDPDGDGDVVASNGTTVIDNDINALRPHGNNGNDIINCATAHPLCGSYRAGFWTNEWRMSRLPDVWNTDPPIEPVDLGPLLGNIRSDAGPRSGTYTSDNIDPQIVFRYRLTDDHSFYAKYASAFKAGGFDTGAGSLPTSDDAFQALKDEYAENYEAGAKGELMQGRIRYDASLFWMITEDLQLETAGFQDGVVQGSDATNAGKQRVRGMEFSFTMAVTDRFTAQLAGALMDGIMLEYPGAGCTDFEFANADTGPCVSAAESIALQGNTDAEATIDRTGEDAPRTPDYKFVMELEYWHPVLDSYKAMFNTVIAFSDGYIDNVEDFDKMIKWNRHTDINFNVGFGDMDDVWKFSIWGRNLLEASTSYNEEFDSERLGIATENMSAADFFTYGVQLEYNFR